MDLVIKNLFGIKIIFNIKKKESDWILFFISPKYFYYPLITSTFFTAITGLTSSTML